MDKFELPNEPISDIRTPHLVEDYLNCKIPLCKIDENCPPILDLRDPPYPRIIDKDAWRNAPSREEIAGQAPDVMHGIETLTNNNGRVRVPEAAARHIDSALRSMVGIYGADRMRQVFKVLAELSPSGNFNAYGFDLHSPAGDTNKTDADERAERLRNIEWLCHPINADRVVSLHRQMRQQGYQGQLPLRDLNENFVNMMIKDDDRRAYIDFSNEARNSMRPATFLQEHREFMYGRRPTDVLRAYQEWLNQRGDN